jgi:hypothetical protein
MLVALDGPNQIALVKPDGTQTIVLTAADGLEGPTSVVIDDWTRTIYVGNAAFVTGKDPNLLLAHLDVPCIRSVQEKGKQGRSLGK